MTVAPKYPPLAGVSGSCPTGVDGGQHRTKPRNIKPTNPWASRHENIQINVASPMSPNSITKAGSTKKANP